MFNEAAIIIYRLKSEFKKNAINSSRINDIAEYALFWRRAQKLTNEYYRQTALKQGNPGEFQARLLKEGEAFWKRLSWTESVPKFNPVIFQDETGKRFGAVINLGTTAGTLD